MKEIINKIIFLLESSNLDQKVKKELKSHISSLNIDELKKIYSLLDQSSEFELSALKLDVNLSIFIKKLKEK